MYSNFCLFKLFIFFCGFSAEVTCAFPATRNNGEIISIKHDKRCYLPHFLRDQGFKGTVVNRELLSWHWG